MAAAIYSGAKVAETDARKEALDDIGRLVRDESLTRHLHAGRGIYRVFIATFGKRHLSRKCITRSAMATAAFCLAFGLQFSLSTGIWLNSRGDDWGVTLLGAFLLGFCLDYVSLLKTRLLLKKAAADQERPLVGLVVLDTAASVSIPILVVFVTNTVDYLNRGFGLRYSISVIPHDMLDILKNDIIPVFTHRSDLFPVLGVLMLSSLMTSIWIAAIWLAGLFLKTLAPVQRFVNWFFPVDEHPIRALGFVAALAVFVASVIVGALHHL